MTTSGHDPEADGPGGPPAAAPPPPAVGAASDLGPPAAPGAGGLRWRLVLALWLLYVGFSWPGHMLGPLGGRHVALAEAFSHGRLRATTPEELALSGDFVFPQGREAGGVSIFAPGTSVLLAPWCAVVRAVAPLPEGALEDPARVARRNLQLFLESAAFIALLAALPMALVARALADLLELIGAPRPGHAVVAFGACSFAFPIACVVSPHPAALACSTWALVQLVRPEPTARRVALAGLAAGCAVLCDFGALVSQALPLAALAAARLRGRARVAFLFGAAPAAALFLAWNTVNYGGPFATPPPATSSAQLERNLTTGLFIFGLPRPRTIAELLFGPWRGLFVYAPWTLLALLGLRSLHRRAPSLAWHAGAVVIVAVFQNAANVHGWHNGPSPGPRYQLPALVVLTAPLAFAWARWPRLVGVGVALSAAVALVLAQAPIYLSVVTAAADVALIGPTLRWLYSVAALAFERPEHREFVVLTSALIGVPLLLVVAGLLEPSLPALRRIRRWIAPAWLAVALPALLGAGRATTRAELGVREAYWFHRWITDPLGCREHVAELLRRAYWADAADLLRIAARRGDEPAAELAALTVRCAQGMAAAGDRPGAQRLVDDVQAALAARAGR